MYNDIKLEKGLYNLTGKSFTEALEALDPSAEYEGTPLSKLDAYQRQLKRFNIRVSGENCDCVEKFFVTTESAILFPEFLRRSIKKGFDETIIGTIVAAKSNCDCNKYIGCVLTDTADYDTTDECDELPTATVTESTDAITLLKYGRVINASYEAVRQQRLDVFAVFLRGIGIKLANSIMSAAITTLTDDITPITTTSLTYADITALCGEFSDFDMNTVLVSPANAAAIFAMTPMQEGSIIDKEGKIHLPFGAELVKTPAVDDDEIIGIDRNFALELITSSDFIMETDKIINHQLDSIAVSVNCGFRRLTDDAVQVLSITEE